MSLHILNCSVDSPDVLPDHIPENLSDNDIESVSELILEHILGFENAISEHDEPDNNDGYSFEFAKIILYFQSTNLRVFSQIEELITTDKVSILYGLSYCSQFHPDIVAPPPQTI